jgi:UTP-glucose-1-phosphate uridylyltransferase
MIPPTRTATARIAKAIQPHCVLLDSSCDAAAAAATAAGLKPVVVVEPEIVVVGGAGVTATTVVVWDNVTVGVDLVRVVTVGVDCVGVVTEGAVRVGVVRVSELVRVPTAEPLPPPHAVRSPTANTVSNAAPPS